MPSSDAILRSLTHIANTGFVFAVAWHVAIALALAAAFLAGVRVGKRSVGWLLCLPVVSVSLFAWWDGNPFNGVVFALLAATLAARTLAAPVTPFSVEPGWPGVMGCLSIAYAWVYPHFLDAASSFIRYLYGAPMGLIPCPTLALVIGLALLTGAPIGVAAAYVLGGVGWFYGLFGVFKLGVYLDVPLLAAASALLVRAGTLQAKRRPMRAAAIGMKRRAML